VIVSENRVLMRKYGPKRDEVTGGWRKLQGEELHNLYSSPNIIRMIKSRRMRGAGHVAHMEATRNVWKILVEKTEWKNHSEDLGVDGMITLKYILGKYVWRVWIGFTWLRIGTGGGLF
jgi:hypothetical protein